jgi:glutathione S-transferase
MKLYYSPGNCSLAPHILVHEAGLDVERVRVVTGPDGRTAGGRNYYEINPLGAVPALALDDEDVLTENAVILQFLAALTPAQAFGPPTDAIARWHFLERLNFVATELHKGFSPLFKPFMQGEPREGLVKGLHSRFNLVERILERQPWLAGGAYGVVDMYAFVVLRWTDRHQIDLTPWPNVSAYRQRIAARPAVKTAMAEQGLI